jgi:hypothetical protein
LPYATIEAGPAKLLMLILFLCYQFIDGDDEIGLGLLLKQV